MRLAQVLFAEYCGIIFRVLHFKNLKVLLSFAQCTQINTTLVMRLKNTFFIRVFDFASLFSCMKKTFMTETFFTPNNVVGGALSGGKTSNKEKNLRKKGAAGKKRELFFLLLW